LGGDDGSAGIIRRPDHAIVLPDQPTPGRFCCSAPWRYAHRKGVTAPRVTILVPHFQTLELIRLCLRSLRRYTEEPTRVRVLDSCSQDASIEYLRSLSWCDLVESTRPNEVWTSHYEMLNRAIAEVETPFFVVMHSDTFVRRHGWLRFLLHAMGERYAAVGPRHQRIVVAPTLVRTISRVSDLYARPWKPGVPFVRSLCALYRTSAYRAAGCELRTTRGEDITYLANERLVAHGCRIRAFSRHVLGAYLFHASGGTVIWNRIPNLTDKKRRVAAGAGYVDSAKEQRYVRSIERFLALPETQATLNDATLDA